jgi:ubiquinone biosynthesis protein
MADAILDVRRALQVAWTALKFGTGPLLRHLLRLPPRGLPDAVRLRLAFEELGLTYLKLGQFLAMRFDILPVEVCRELSRLYEGVPPLKLDEVRRVIETELGKPLEELYSVFHAEPIAAASVAQVHEARTMASERVAVKVQRPGVDRFFAADMRNLSRMAAFADWLGVLGDLSLREAAQEFANYTQRELDFVTEGHTADRLRQNATPHEVVPRVYWELTTSKVLTLEFVEGISLAQLSSLLEAGKYDLVRARLPHLRVELALHHLAVASLRQLFVTGFFHADPHPGNVLIRDDNSVAFVDFGIFGQLTAGQREIFVAYIENLALGNIEQSFRHYSRLYTASEDTDWMAFRREATAILRAWYQVSTDPHSSVEQRHLGYSTDQMLRVVRRHRLRMSMDTLLFWRALFALDSSALRLSHHFDLLHELRLFFEERRPGVTERLLELVTNEERTLAVAELALGPAEAWWSLLGGPPGSRTEIPCTIARRKPMERGGQTAAARLTGALIGLGLAVLVTAVRLDATARTLLGLLLFFFLWGAVMGWRRT